MFSTQYIAKHPKTERETDVTIGDEGREDFLKVLGHLLERQLDGVELSLLQHPHQVHDALPIEAFFEWETS